MSQKIKQFLAHTTTSKIHQRGRTLFNQNAVKLEKYDPNKDIFTFKVQGSKLYTVVIKNVYNRLNLETSCTCPYDWGPVCKHTVAALLYIEQHFGDFPPEKEGNEYKPSKKLYRDANTPIVIEDFKNLDYDKLSLKFVDSRFLYEHKYFDILDTQIENGQLIIMLEGNAQKPYKVTISYQDNKLIINSTEKTRVLKNSLKPTEFFVLQYFINNKEKLLSFLDKEQFRQLQEDLTREYGLDIKDFDKYFGFEIEPKEGIRIYKKEIAKNLISLDPDKNEISQLIKKLNDLSYSPVLKLKQQKKEEENKVGYALYYTPNSFRPSYWEYVPFYGKLSKRYKMKFIGNPLVISDFAIRNLILSHEDLTLIKLIHKFNSVRNESYEDSFALSKQIFLELQKQKRVYLYDGRYAITNSLRAASLEKTSFSTNFANTFLKITQDKNFVYARVYCKLDNKTVLLAKVLEDGAIDPNIVYYDGVFYHWDTPKDYLLSKFYPEGLKVAREHKHILYQKVIEPLSKEYEIEFEENIFNIETVALDYKKKQIYLSEDGEFIIIRLQVVYDNDIPILLHTSGDYIVKNEKDGTIVKYVRNIELENDFLEEISTLHPSFEEQKVNKFFYLHFDDFVNDLWFYKFFDYLSSHQIEVYGIKELKKFKFSPHKAKVSVKLSSGIDWFDVNVEIKFGDNILSISDIQQAILNKQRYIRLGDGSVGILPEKWLHKLEKYIRHASVIEKDTLKISKLRFSIIDELFDQIDDMEILKEIGEKKRKLREITHIEKVKIPKSVKAKLRDYQKQGVNWLNFLHQMGWGGILADDMGLGKTLQVLTFLKIVLEKDKTPNLIIVPTTLLFNWRNEIEKFVPDLKALYYHGPNRQLDRKDFKDYDIIFTTYGILLRDIEWLRKFQFNYVILDESQAIKNPASRRFKAASLLKAKNRLALTGTPIENSTLDLYAQMSFVNPGFFGNLTHFKNNYLYPIDRDGNEFIASELQRLVNPFILRRTKEQVASELPPKVEVIIYCEMPPAQRQIYETYKDKYRQQIIEKIEEEGVNKSKFMILEALTRLRQICDSPFLLNDENINIKDSAKINEILLHITDKTANHKLLIFSQFTSMLALLREELDKLNIPYEYLDGKSSQKQRELSVQRFQTDPDLRVFLISLKAGGTGLNLTAADYVYLLDPWWNPAVENQAIDRIYRIGQDKKVFAYRMICKNTIEEKILDLQAKKKKLAANIIQAEENILKTLDINDIRKLFE